MLVMVVFVSFCETSESATENGARLLKYFLMPPQATPYTVDSRFQMIVVDTLVYDDSNLCTKHKH